MVCYTILDGDGYAELSLDLVNGSKIQTKVENLKVDNTPHLLKPNRFI